MILFKALKPVSFVTWNIQSSPFCALVQFWGPSPKYGDSDAHHSNGRAGDQAFALMKESWQSPATLQLQAELRLLKLLNKHNASLQLFPAIHDWARDSTKLKHDFSRCVRPRSRVFLELEDRFDMQDARFTPNIVSYLPDEGATVVNVASHSLPLFIHFCLTKTS